MQKEKNADVPWKRCHKQVDMTLFFVGPQESFLCFLLELTKHVGEPNQPRWNYAVTTLLFNTMTNLWFGNPLKFTPCDRNFTLVSMWYFCIVGKWGIPFLSVPLFSTVYCSTSLEKLFINSSLVLHYPALWILCSYHLIAWLSLDWMVFSWHPWEQ